ncbi:MAG: hypothetical protein LBQ59_03545 [Candidatus Peribacteria bacterium]|jgi:hypothetical protein|nr:hypothetical protein [Candidatus Peribacteria bacterium]
MITTTLQIPNEKYSTQTIQEIINIIYDDDFLDYIKSYLDVKELYKNDLPPEILADFEDENIEYIKL